MREARTYGNWLRPRTPGLGQLGLLGTAGLFAGVILTIGVLAFSLSAGLVVGAIVALALLPLALPDKWGRSRYEVWGERLRWWNHRSSRSHVLQAGPLSPTPITTCRLPGLAAPIRAHDAFDAHQRPFVVLAHPRTHHVATVIECLPSGDALVDPDQVDQWVAGWGEWLSNLGYEAGIVGASVTVETAPDTGVRLRRSVTERLVADAAPMALNTMRETIETFGAGAASTRVFVTITWSQTREGARRRSVEDAAAEIGSRLPDLTASLELAGAGRSTPMTKASLATALRAAWNPALATDLEENPDQVDWDDCGPVRIDERARYLEHDEAVSVSWVMGEAPRGAVRSNILSRTLAPHPEVDRKRVTLLYRPYDSARSAQLVEQDVATAMFAATVKKRTKARDTVSVAAARHSASEEARGATLVRFAAIVTATITRTDDPESDEDRVGRARSVVEHLGSAARIKLRPAHRSQASTFLAGLPLGLVLPTHVKRPEEWLNG